MNIEELMRPRVKCIGGKNGNHYLGSDFIVGDILTYFKGKHLSSRYIGDNGSKLAESTIADYPHLFQPLQWWQDRKTEDLPEYVKARGKVFKMNGLKSECVFNGEDWTPIQVCEPATLEEYETYKTKTIINEH